MSSLAAVLALFAHLIHEGSGLDNGMARLPIMGWNTWCAFGPCGTDRCSEQQVLDSIAALSQNGMAAAGYNYITLDDCFAMRRDALTKDLYPDPALFPQGFSKVVQAAHAAGFYFGIYTSAGNYTCHAKEQDCNGTCNVGSLGYYEHDAQLFASWKLDFVKTDWCSASVVHLSCRTQYGEMAKALNATGRPITLYMSCGGMARAQDWAREVANIWRVGNDHLDCWDDACAKRRGYRSANHGTKEVIANLVGISKFAGPGGWNTPDFLKTGGVGCADQLAGHLCPNQTLEEYRTEFSLWVITNAPLLVSTDIRQLTSVQREILLNPEVIQVNQDPLAKAGDLIASYNCDSAEDHELLASGNSCQMWAKHLLSGWATALVNFGSTRATIALNMTLLGVPRGCLVRVRDLWAQKDLGEYSAEGLSVAVPPHGTKLLKIVSKDHFCDYIPIVV